MQTNGTTIMKKVIFESVDAEFLRILTEELNVSHEVVATANDEYDRWLCNGNRTEIVGMFLQIEADVVFHMTEE